MSAFNAFKACVPIEWSRRLYITLVRGLPGTRRLHRRTLEAMRLRRCNRTVIHRTTPSLLGMLNQKLAAVIPGNLGMVQGATCISNLNDPMGLDVGFEANLKVYWAMLTSPNSYQWMLRVTDSSVHSE